MLSLLYLHGLDAVEFEIPGIYYVRHSRHANSFRILATYRGGIRSKAKLFAKLEADGQIENPATWDFHHVVEGQHFADIDFLSQLPGIYDEGLPCVLLAQEEHRAYNSLLHSGTAIELFRPPALSHPPLARRSVPPLRPGPEPFAEAPKLRIENLRLMYRTAYDGDAVLQAVARNVFDVAAANLS